MISGVSSANFERSTWQTESSTATRSALDRPLSPKQEREVEALKKRDQEVRRHEQAHLAAAGSLARGGATYQFQIGPDGQRYAIAGEVSVDTSPGRTPEETIAKAQTLRAAALAPADPSGADRAAAAMASNMEAAARKQLAENGSPSEAREATASQAPMPQPRFFAAYHGVLQCNCHRILPGAVADLAV